MSSVVSSKSLAALLSAAATLASVSEARVVFQRHTGAGLDWTQANQFCLDKYDTLLAGVASSGTNAELQGLATGVYSADAWLGLHDAPFEGFWSNVGGESARSYTNWETNQPNDWGTGGQDCGYMMTSNGKWADSSCSSKYYAFYCDAPAWLPASTIGGDDWVLVYGAGSKTWSQAAQYCHDVMPGSTLASVHSSSQNSIMSAAMQNRGKNRAFIGFDDFTTEGTWEWSDGSNVDYTNWASGQPDNHGSGQDCAVIWETPVGTWDDDTCSKTYDAFFCKLL